MSTEPSVFFCSPWLCEGAGHIADEAVAGAVVDRCRPVLPHRRIGRHGEAIVLAAIKTLPVPVINGHQIELAFPEMLGREEGESENKTATVDGILVWIGEAILRCLEIVGQRRERPAADIEIGWCEDALIPAFQEGVGFAGGRVEDVL